MISRSAYCYHHSNPAIKQTVEKFSYYTTDIAAVIPMEVIRTGLKLPLYTILIFKIQKTQVLTILLVAV